MSGIFECALENTNIVYNCIDIKTNRFICIDIRIK